MDDLPERSAPADPIAPAPASRPRRALRAGAAVARQAAPYAAVAILGTALCFFLHYLGNGLPREMARQRFADAPTSAAAGLPQPELGGVEGIGSLGARAEYCTYALAVLGGSDGGGDPLLDAILLKSWDAGNQHCEAYDAAAGGEELPRTTLKTRYWWGGKALFAVGLRFLSVAEFHQLIRVSMYAAWAAFAVALWLLSRRALAVATPLIALGVLASGIELFADIGNGLPYAWAVWAAAILALLLRKQDSRAARAAPLFCFAAGMASSYLWLLDGHTILAVPLIGLVAWFGYGRLRPGARARRAARCVALYAAGFAVCFALGQAVKVAAYEATTSGFDVLGRGPAQTLLSGIDSKLERTADDPLGTATAEWRSCWDCEPQGWRRLTLAREYLLGVQPFSVAEARILGAASLLALAAAAAAAGARAWRGETGPVPDLLWLAGLTALVVPQLLIQDDVAYRVARYVFLPLALCWSCLILVLPELRRAHASLLAGGVLAVALGAWGWQALRAETALAAFDGVRPVVRADFEVYHSGNRLMYVKPECGWSDAAFLQPIVLHAFPAAGAGPPDPELERIGFLFREHQLPLFRRCAAIVDLPGYDIERVRTGQWMWEAPEPVWFEGYRVNRPGADLEAYRVEYAALAGEEPAARSEFDLYLGERSLTLVKRECTPADTQARVFLHVVPVDPGDLAEARRGRGFDNLDFSFLDRGAWFDGRCMATAGLPPYAVARIRAGQRTAGGDLWSTTIALAPSEGGPSIEALREARARLAGREPAARAAFDLHVEGGTLFYVRGECGQDDAAAPFFLHVTPLDAGDLPEERRAAGFENLDFAFLERGWRIDGACVAAVELPEYGIASVRTGQWVRGEGTLWRAEFAPGP